MRLHLSNASLGGIFPATSERFDSLQLDCLCGYGSVSSILPTAPWIRKSLDLTQSSIFEELMIYIEYCSSYNRNWISGLGMGNLTTFFDNFLAPPLPFGQMRSSTSWVLHLLSFLLSFFLSFCLTPEESWKNLSILMLGLWNFARAILGHNH